MISSLCDVDIFQSYAVLAKADTVQYPKNHKAGLVGPAFFAVELVWPILFRSPAQDVKISTR